MKRSPSGLKAHRQSLRRKAVNDKIKSKFRAAVKTVRQLTAGGQLDEAQKALALAYSTLDKAVKKHVIHRNKAARLKSRLTKKAAK